MKLEVASFAERPDLATLHADFEGAWPPFMHKNRLSSAYYDKEALTLYPEFVLIGMDLENPDRAAAFAYSIPFEWNSPSTHPEHLPPDGWDGMFVRAYRDRILGRRGNTVGAVEVVVRPDLQMNGFSSMMLHSLLQNSAKLGFSRLVAPVRPIFKSREPWVSMEDYVKRVRPDGLPFDPWLRVHVRAGGRIVSIAPCSMTMAGNLGQWRQWANLPFDQTGPIFVPGALVPVHVDAENDHAVYVEPNVWIEHDLSPYLDHKYMLR